MHIGAAEIEGRLLLETRPAAVGPLRARVALTRPTVCYPGSRLILRRLSPKDLLGGAVIVDSIASGAERGDRPLDDSGDQPFLAILERVGLAPIAARQVATSANVREDVAEAVLTRLVQSGRIVALSKPLEYLSRESYEAAFENAVRCLRTRHVHAPWRIGCSTAEIAAAVGVSDALAVRLLAAWHEDGRIGHRARYWHLPEFTPSLSREQRAFFDRELLAQAQASLMPASYDAVVQSADASRVPGVREALESLVATGALVRIGDDLYRRTQVTRARDLIVDFLQNSGAGATMAQLRDVFGTSRKYALPLLEHFDSIGVTVRDGDLRRLRSPAGKTAAQVQK